MEPMGRLEFTSPKQAWGGEAEAFTPLLAQPDLLDYLGEATGIGPLTPIETEHSTAGGRSLDILAETIDGKRVSIENQYSQADHDHFTRGLAYAVATESTALVVVAEGHRDEFIAVADYLNDLVGRAEEGISVWLITVRAVRRVGDGIWSPEFVVEAEPNEWTAAVRRETTPRLSSLKDFYDRGAELASPEFAASAQEIVEGWLERPGAREDHNTKTSVGLYYPSPAHPDRGTNVLQVQTNGSVVVCRGYILEIAGVFDSPEALDQQIRRRFPDAYWPPKMAYIRQQDPKPEQVAAFADWLTERFDSALGRGGG